MKASLVAHKVVNEVVGLQENFIGFQAFEA